MGSRNPGAHPLRRRWNIGLADGGSQRLPRIIGFGRSLERALEFAEFICALPQPAIRTDKEAAVRGFGMPLADGLRIEAQCFNRSIHHPEKLEGLRRFNERDHPDRRPGEAPLTPGISRDTIPPETSRSG
jgi:enoyl-CoA hydratase